MKRIQFSVGPHISSVHRLRLPFHTWPVLPRAVSLLCVALIFTATASAQIGSASPLSSAAKQRSAFMISR